MFGAKAVLVRSVQTGDGPPHTGAVAYVKGYEIPAAVLSVQAADRLEQELQKHGKVSVRLKIDPKPVPTKREQANVVIRIPGTSLAEQIVLVSAHLDSHDITPGAADDAAGVAAVLAVMRRFAKNRPARTILLVLFADEELDGSGSKTFIKTHEDDLAKTVAAMELDDGDGKPYALQVTSSAPEAAAAKLRMGKIAESVGDEAKGLPILTSQETNGADLEKLWACYGIPEVAILQDLTTYFDRHHAENDTPENINWDGLERTTHLLERITEVLTSGDMTPLPGPKKLPCPGG
jgi:acetylornithine deacetylase/succinyl-diaminopimelate desuccinylase-like protein